MSALLPLAWVPREPPLPPLGVAAHGDCARRIVQRLLQRDDEALARLTGVAGRGFVVLLGPAEALPWSDGALYLGRDPEAPELLLPTTLTSGQPLSLVARALRLRHPELEPPLVVLPQAGAVIPVSAARPLDRRVLEKWRGGSG